MVLFKIHSFQVTGCISTNKVDEVGYTGLHLACFRGRLGVVQLLVDQMDNKQMNINVKDNEGYNALVFAIQHEEIAKVLLQTGNLDIKNIKIRLRIKIFDYLYKKILRGIYVDHRKCC